MAALPCPIEPRLLDIEARQRAAKSRSKSRFAPSDTWPKQKERLDTASRSPAWPLLEEELRRRICLQVVGKLRRYAKFDTDLLPRPVREIFGW
jgi:hypothetical protein